MTKIIRTEDLLIFHTAYLEGAGWTAEATNTLDHNLRTHIESNHKYNSLLWKEEDEARRTDVPDSFIAKNKRAIDGFNQNRNDAIERIDEVILSFLSNVTVNKDARLNSETAGSMIDRLSILSLKIKAMKEQTLRTDAGSEHIDACQLKLERLNEQRKDLAACLDNLLDDFSTGHAFYKVYRQFKMYNDPTLNPYLYGATK